MNNEIWFKRKLYGWGWTPSTWEGWLVTFSWLVVFIYLMQKIAENGLIKNVVIIFLMTYLLIFICYKKGEKPKWQWGKRLEDK